MTNFARDQRQSLTINTAPTQISRRGAAAAYPGAKLDWTIPLPGVFRALDGKEIRTLKDAADLLSGHALGCHDPAVRQVAADLLVRAARTCTPNDVAAASERVGRFLLIERVAHAI
ncbi:hypothetical protein ABLE91_16990 [Aquabacter sp. CN5-332]|uniref:hypothetical protein n=1 Tax=Aquabacter sp. CN5-332 TaxID=3156608 RepID=UPI0032B41237